MPGAILPGTGWRHGWTAAKCWPCRLRARRFSRGTPDAPISCGRKRPALGSFGSWAVGDDEDDELTKLLAEYGFDPSPMAGDVPDDSAAPPLVDADQE